MDHVVDPSWWHGTDGARKRRKVPGTQASRVDGSWEEGVPYRTSYWLTTLGEYPQISQSVATLSLKRPTARTQNFPPQLLKTTLTPVESIASAQPSHAPARNRLMPKAHASGVAHDFVPASAGPTLSLEPTQSGAALHEALAPYAHIGLLRVSMTDAKALLGCVSAVEHSNLEQLFPLIFQHRWCYRPWQMLPGWKDMSQWCVWGYKTPKVPPTCQQ